MLDSKILALIFIPKTLIIAILVLINYNDRKHAIPIETTAKDLKIKHEKNNKLTKEEKMQQIEKFESLAMDSY